MWRIFGGPGWNSLQQQMHWLQVIVPVLAVGWFIVLISLMSATRDAAPRHYSVDTVMFLLSGALLFGQLCLIVLNYRCRNGEMRRNRAYRNECWIAVTELAVQTFLGLWVLTVFIFRANGVFFWKCVRSPSSCGDKGFEQGDIAILWVSVAVYILALSTIILLIQEYTRLLPPESGGQPVRAEPREGFMRTLQLLELLFCVALSLLAIAGFLMHGYALYVLPFIVSLKVFVEISGQLAGSRPSWQQAIADSNAFIHNTCIVQDLKCLFGFSYLACLQCTQTFCSAARVGPSTMKKEHLQLFLLGVVMHLLVSLAYYTNIKVLLGLRRQLFVEHFLSGLPRHGQGAPLVHDAHRPQAPTRQAGGRQCVQCKVRVRNYLALPCGHFAVCHECKDLVQNICPMCRGRVEDWYPVLWA